MADKRGLGMWSRSTWVESLRSAPFQMKQIATLSTPYRFLQLLIHATWIAVHNGLSLARFCISVLRGSYEKAGSVLPYYYGWTVAMTSRVFTLTYGILCAVYGKWLKLYRLLSRKALN